jgi:hypothetical protein
MIENSINGQIIPHPLLSPIDFGRGEFVNILDFMQNDFREKYINDQYMNIELRDHIKKALEE